MMRTGVAVVFGERSTSAVGVLLAMLQGAPVVGW
jgi:hypothetical protein